MSFIPAAIGAVGSVAQGFMDYQAAGYQASVAKANQKIAEQSAEGAIRRGQISAQNQDFKNREQMGSILAGQAASGLAANAGSNVRVRESAAAVGRLDTETTMYNAEMDSYGLKRQADNFGMEAKMAKRRGKMALLGGALGAASSLSTAFKPGGKTLVGATSAVSPKWADWHESYHGTGGY
jgi:hypothetical protein